MSDVIVSLDKINKGFRSGFLTQKKQILFDVSFEVKKGSVVGFIGANGAGKSTTMKTMLGLVKPDSGSVSFFGQNKFSVDQFKKIGFLPERPNFYKFLSAEEFLIYYGKLSNVFSSKELKVRVKEVLEEVGLYENKDKLIGGYSKGMNQRVGIAQALLHRPEFIVLDEPLSGLDPDGRFELGQIIQRAANIGCTVFFSSHLLDDTEKLCNSIIIIKQGRITYSGSMQSLIDSGEKGFVINYLFENKNLVETVLDQKSLEEKIKILNSKNANIVNIERKAQTLEQAYVNMVSQ